MGTVRLADSYKPLPFVIRWPWQLLRTEQLLACTSALGLRTQECFPSCFVRITIEPGYRLGKPPESLKIRTLLSCGRDEGVKGAAAKRADLLVQPVTALLGISA